MFNFIKNATRSSGFSLIEMLVVVAIIGILAGAVMVSTNSARQQGRDAKRKADIESLSSALEIYYSTNKLYPTPDGMGSDVAGWVQLYQIRTLLENYINSWTTDPKPLLGGHCATGDSNLAGYCYYVNADKSKYVLDVILEKHETPTITISSPAIYTTDADFYQSGIYTYNSANYYRVAGK